MLTQQTRIRDQIHAGGQGKIIANAQGQMGRRSFQVRGEAGELRQREQRVVEPGTIGPNLVPVQKNLGCPPRRPPGTDARPAFVPSQAGAFRSFQF